MPFSALFRKRTFTTFFNDVLTIGRADFMAVFTPEERSRSRWRTDLEREVYDGLADRKRRRVAYQEVQR